MGGEEKINDYCHNLAIEGGKLLAKILGTRVMDPDGEQTLNMVRFHKDHPRENVTDACLGECLVTCPGQCPGELESSQQSR